MRSQTYRVVIAFCLILICNSDTRAGELTDDALIVFEAGTSAVANDVNSNFNAVQGEINDNNTRITDNTNDIITNATNIDSLSNAGLIAFCGNGSAGDKVISTDENWVNDPPDDVSFNNLTINEGVTLTVSAGTVIRCVGNFTNNGVISVMECTGAYNESLGAPTGSDASQVSSQSHPGDAGSAATAGWYDNEGDTDPSNTYGGIGGKRIAKGRLLSFNNVRIGGGSGAGYGAGACGGGLIKVYCKGSITNVGDIIANGTSYWMEVFSGNGGGAGGIVILASLTSIDNSNGWIHARGGDGSYSFVDTTNNQYSHGPGGGGGGGIVILAAPSINQGSSNIDVSGGPSGATPLGVATGYNRFGGGGGGGCGGNGGNGGHIDKDGNVFVDGSSPIGEDGQIIILTINPLSRIF